MTPRFRLIAFLVLLLGSASVAFAEVSVSTLLKLDASGRITSGPEGYIYASDFRPQLGPAEAPTKVYRINPDTGEYSIFADGFDGASGSAFDNDGNFYQAEPRGNRVIRISRDGERRVLAANLKTPIGVQVDKIGDVIVCNCAGSEILKIKQNGEASVFAADAELMQCPNGLTQDDAGNFYAVTFGAGNVLKITPEGVVSLLAELPVLTGGPNPVGLGHITFANGVLYVTAIGTGMIYQVTLTGESTALAGIAFAFANVDGAGDVATFSKPNGIAASPDGKRLFINVSDPTWAANPSGLHPASIRVVSGF